MTRLLPTLLVALGYVAATFIAARLLSGSLKDAAIVVRLMLVALPVIAMLVATRVVVSQILRGDELERRIDLEAIAVSALLVGFGCLTVSWLLKAGLLTLPAHTAMAWVLPAMLTSYVVARMLAGRRYQ